MPKIARNGACLLAVSFVSGCTTFPASVEEGVVDIKQVTDSVECELAAVVADPHFKSWKLSRWSALTDLDLTLVRSLGADGKGTVTAPSGLATVSVSPSLGIAGTDTSIAHVQFAPDMAQAAKRFGNSCMGADPSETRMGLAIWFASALDAVQPAELAGVTYTKQFEIVANAGARFGYSLVPAPTP
jgi:hypothetical protein